MTDLDSQLKKKSSDADKISHFLEQLRIKQERIQELESKSAHYERQSNQERQTFDKQAHENWLNARKIEKELKESRLECAALKDKLNEVDTLNKSLSENNSLFKQQAMQQSGKNFYLSPMNQQYQAMSTSQLSKKSADSPNKTDADLSHQIAEAANNSDPNVTGEPQPLQIDTEQAPVRPASTSSTSSGVQQPPMSTLPLGMHPSFPYIRPPMQANFRYPFPPMQAYMQQQQQANENPVQFGAQRPNPMMQYPNFQSPQSMLYRMHPMMMQQQQYMQQQQQQQHLNVQPIKSSSSSPQPSPAELNQSISFNSTHINGSSHHHHMPSSATFPNISSSNLDGE